MVAITRKIQKIIRRNLLLFTLLLSFSLHIGILFLHLKESNLSKKLAKKAKNKSIQIKLLSKKKTKQNKKKRQIVTTEKKDNKKKPEDSRFLGESDQRFDRQTVAKGIGSFKAAGKGIEDGSERPDTQSKKKSIKKSLTKKEARNRKKKISFKDLALNPEKTKIDLPEKSKKSKALGLENGEGAKIGLSRNNDFVEDIPLGDVTNLNTVEFKYYGFYNRIKKKLEQYWGYDLKKKAMALYQSGRRMPSNENMITSLVVTLDGKGNIVNIMIKSTSGVQELDDVAVESFSKAGPFPNPPQGMVKNGLAKIEWGFVVKG